MKKLAISAAALICTLLASSVSTAQTPAPEPQARDKRVGIMSVIGQTYTRQYIAMTVFGNELEEMDSSSWGTDDEYERQAAAALSALGGIEVVQGQYSRKDFARLGATSRPDWAAVADRVKEYCAKNQADAILVAYPTGAPGDFAAGSGQGPLRGAGSYSKGGTSDLVVAAQVALVDCQTATPTASRNLGTPRRQGGSVMSLLGSLGPASSGDSPSKRVASELGKTPLKQLTEEQLANFRRTLVDLPKSSWAAAVRALLGK